MSNSPHPPLDTLLPQSGRMALLDRILDHDGDSTTCAVSPDDHEWFRGPDGRVPAWVSIEYMAQCCAAHGGLLLRDAPRKTPPAALLLGVRRIDLYTESFAPGSELQVTVRPAAGSGRAAAFQCSIRDGERLLADARLSFYAPEEPAGGTGHARRG